MRDQSFGVIPVRRQNGLYLFLLVQHHAGHWAFPKGHAENGESDSQAALRELREETGITNVALVDDISLSETYFFKRSGLTVTKTVRYFLGLVRGRNVRIQAAEIKDSTWASYEKASTLITFSESMRLLHEAHTYLEQHRVRIEQLFETIGE